MVSNAVSYTHLDVYKRQSGTSSVFISLFLITWNWFRTNCLSNVPCFVPRVWRSLFIFITTAITFRGTHRPRSTSGVFTNTLSPTDRVLASIQYFFKIRSACCFTVSYTHLDVYKRQIMLCTGSKIYKYIYIYIYDTMTICVFQYVCCII